MKKFNENDKIVVENLTDSPVGINLPQYLLNVQWEGKNAKKSIPYGKLEQAMFHYGVNYMFTTGILYIEDMDAKKALGLEPEEAEEPENIIVLNDKQRKRLLTTAPIEEFKQTLSQLSYEQIKELAHYAITNEILDFARNEILKEAVNIDVIRMIQLNRESKEVEQPEKKNKG